MDENHLLSILMDIQQKAAIAAEKIPEIERKQRDLEKSVAQKFEKVDVRQDNIEQKIARWGGGLAVVLMLIAMLAPKLNALLQTQ